MKRLNEREYGQRSTALAAREEALARPADVAAGLDRFKFRELRGLLWREFGAAWAACGMFERVSLSYLGVSSGLIALFAENVAHPLRLLGTQAFVAIVILALCRVEALMASRGMPASRNRGAWLERGRVQARLYFGLLRLTAAGRGDTKPAAEAGSQAGRTALTTLAQRFWHFWRHWYPHLFFLFCFEQMGKLVHLVQPEWQDAKLIAFDQWLTGVNPSLWLEQFSRPALTEFMEFSYFTYFLFLLILGAILYQRRELKDYWAVMTYSAIGYSLGYVIATIFPVQSPWFTFAGMWHADLAGGPFTALVSLIEKCGRVHGAAFPSQHVAGATAALWGAWRHRRWLFWVFLPFVICMCASTVYVRNHYVADVFGGLITGTLGYVIGAKLLAKRPTHQALWRLSESRG